MNRFRRDQRGNIAVIFAITCLPLISAIGCAIDYSEATRIKAKLQSAADAAALASISQRSNGWLAASTMTTNGEVSVAETDAANIFDGNAKNAANNYTNGSRSAVVMKTGATVTATVNFSADVPVTFMKAVGFQKLTVSGVSKASITMPLYLDFYLTLDVSGSMGLPSTTSEAQRMQWVNPDNTIQYPTGCTLACHFAPRNSACRDPGTSGATQGYPTNGYCLGYAISRVSQSGYQNLLTLQSPQGKYPYKNLNPNLSTYGKYQQLSSTIVSGLPNSLYSALPPVSSCPTDGTDACIQLRLDAVGYAVNQLLATANNKQVVANQFRIGLYPFIQYLNANYSPLTSSISPGSSITTAAANLASLLDTNMDSTLGSGGTHIDNALHAINNTIVSVGSGTAPTNTLPYVFLVTDGAQDNQMKGVPNGGWSGSNHATVLNNSINNWPNACATLKNRGIIVSVLYIPYQPISPVNASFAGDEDDYANWNIPNIPASLQSCASPPDAGGSYFYTANTPTDINNALNAMFNHSIQTAHITN